VRPGIGLCGCGRTRHCCLPVRCHGRLPCRRRSATQERIR
jgi:hypothetical protein